MSKFVQATIGSFLLSLAAAEKPAECFTDQEFFYATGGTINSDAADVSAFTEDHLPSKIEGCGTESFGIIGLRMFYNTPAGDAEIVNEYGFFENAALVC